MTADRVKLCGRPYPRLDELLDAVCEATATAEADVVFSADCGWPGRQTGATNLARMMFVVAARHEWWGMSDIAGRLRMEVATATQVWGAWAQLQGAEAADVAVHVLAARMAARAAAADRVAP